MAHYLESADSDVKDFSCSGGGGIENGEVQRRFHLDINYLGPFPSCPPPDVGENGAKWTLIRMLGLNGVGQSRC